MDLFFPFIIHEEHRLSEQAIVLAGLSIQHNRRKSVLKQFDLSDDSKAFKRELDVLAQIQLHPCQQKPGGLPEILGFAFGAQEKRAELMMSHCGIDLNQAWLHYMESRPAAQAPDFKLKVVEMGQQVLSALGKLHEVGYCHWDLKLDNICVADGYYYLIDFALAQHILQPTSKGTYRKIKHFKATQCSPRFANTRCTPTRPLSTTLSPSFTSSASAWTSSTCPGSTTTSSRQAQTSLSRTGCANTNATTNICTSRCLDPSAKL